ncbi:MAG: major capsid protein [Arizlama microvirus]|nr:MAG: major capsid protein [Arizlama microvirus]
MQQQHRFSEVPQAEIPRSRFDRTHGIKTTLDAGYLVPVFWDLAVPGDSFNLRSTLFGRLATPLHPFMDNAFLETFFFAVPIRLIWDNFQRFMGEQPNPDDSTDFLMPTITSPTVGGGYQEGTIYDKFGYPTLVPNLTHNILKLRSYNLIWNEWFRDQNLQDSVPVPRDDGPDDVADYVLLRRGKRHDYFTSCLPWPQKGPAVDLPLGSVAPIVSTGAVPSFSSAADTNKTLRLNSSIGLATTPGPAGDNAAWFGNVTGLEADLSDATAATINQLRQAFQIQRLLERDARGGTRYIEIIRSHFGVTSPDARLQRPEFLGGGSSRINVSAVPQTSSTDSEPTPQGNLAAFGTVSANGHGFTKSFTEHTMVIGLVSIRADLNYQQGLDRFDSISTRYDLYWPSLSHLGEQAVLNKEIYAQNDSITGALGNEGVFGYQERYAEYRYKPGVITGQFRSNFAQSLDTWHLAQDFDALPSLNDEFIVENPPFDRIIAVPSFPHLILDGYMKYHCARPMPVYSVPGLIDHF